MALRQPHLAVPLRDRDRARDRRIARRAADLPARARSPVRGRSRDGHRAGLDRAWRRRPQAQGGGGGHGLVILTRGIVVRIALLLIAGVVVQLGFLSHISVLGGTPYVLPVL